MLGLVGVVMLGGVIGMVGIVGVIGTVGVVPVGVVGVLDEDANRQLPRLGSVLASCAAPPKTQLVGIGFFW